MSLHNIMQGLSTTDCEWTSSNASSSYTPVSDSLKRRELLEEFIVWYFGSFVAPLLRARHPYSICLNPSFELMPADYFLHNRVLRIQEQSSVLSSRRLGCALCSSDRTTY